MSLFPFWLWLLRALLGFLPVCAFMAGLVALDSYKLVRLRWVLLMVACGGLAAGLSFLFHRHLLAAGHLDPRLLTRLVAPAVEESLKGLAILALLKARRVGFVIDAGILGFALGTGFALVENVYYLWALPNAPVALWAIRGLGTAVMHGGTTAILAMATKAIMGRRETTQLRLALPGLALAFAIHAGFNQFLLSPLVEAMLVILILPTLMAVVFGQSETLLRAWLGQGFDLDQELLEAVRVGDFHTTRPGRYIQSLKDCFEGPVLADMLCYLRLHAELSIKAKVLLILRQAGLPDTHDPQLADSLAELAYLRKSIGPAGELAMAPLLQRFTQDQWQHQLLS
jgi:RsiW-degrading membrane proteinase PrsW (M82 family)